MAIKAMPYDRPPFRGWNPWIPAEAGPKNRMLTGELLAATEKPYNRSASPRSSLERGSSVDTSRVNCALAFHRRQGYGIGAEDGAAAIGLNQHRAGVAAGRTQRLQRQGYVDRRPLPGADRAQHAHHIAVAQH